MFSNEEFLGDGDEVTDDEVEGDGGWESVGDEGNHEGHDEFHLELHVTSKIIFETLFSAGFFSRQGRHGEPGGDKLGNTGKTSEDDTLLTNINRPIKFIDTTLGCGINE